MWLLTGIALRMGQRLNPWDDGGNFQDRSIYDVQLRRRLWWQIIWLDGRSHQASGQKILFTDAINFPLPANLNDSDISPNMTEMPPIHKGPTEMTFCLIRYEMGKFLTEAGKKLHSPQTSVPEKDEIIDAFEDLIEEKYLRYLDPAITVHMIAAGGGRAAIWKMRLMAHHPAQYSDKGKSMPQSEHDKLFSWSVQLVECHVEGKATKDLDCFSWHLDAIFQVDAFVFMLIESRSQPPTSPLTEKAWHLVAETYKFRPGLLKDSTNTLHAAVNELTLRAWEAREKEVARRGLEPIAVPPIIFTLRDRIRNNMLLPSAMDAQPEVQTVYQTTVDPTQAGAGFDINHVNVGLSQPLAQPNVGYLFDGIFDTFTGEVGLSDWGAVNWDDWNTLIERNFVP